MWVDQSMCRETKSIVIVGAGPAGMMLAWLLIKNGIEVKIIERHLDFSREFRGEGIQESVVQHLEDLGLLPAIMSKKIGIAAEAARVFFDEKLVATLKGSTKGLTGDANFGIILHQAKFLSYLHDELLKNELFESYLGYNAVKFEENNDKITHVITKDKHKTEHRIAGELVVVTTGRGTALRKKLNLEADKIDTHWNILWVILPKPNNEEIVPKGFRAYLNGETLFIMYTNSDGLVQMAWCKKNEKDLKIKDFGLKKSILLNEVPKPYKELVETGYLE
ncbi:MAG: FAD-dependent monooxygenase, partial [Cyanobacteria bacterium J06555_13]